ncbi:MAG: hypothetical protein HC794_05170 [Nitrospiraceae bacterium]|nr:hypothetical protein [Nitrospiraceae bacterium]
MRPNREASAEILKVYLTEALPLDQAVIAKRGGEPRQAVASLIDETIEAIFKRTDENRLLSIRLRNGQNNVLYRGDLVSGAILSSIVQRAKEQAIERTIQSGSPAGLLAEDLFEAVAEEFRQGESVAAGRCGGRVVEAAGPSSGTGRRYFFVPPRTTV